ncbi:MULTISPECIES: DUF5065 family protein [Bacillus]|uniref:DUF5065 domain-containing protein n=1 Tax=Bacillus wiedmannii TaxID=1890302 RepID=A0ABX5DYT0_9BACI|nr:DUF5065 family protein [Bacillus wiedmannii]PDZ46534.1 DUF5065 domain-containing protein [Bacillus wiedmannii]PRT07968.1 DUF5065 domain-containing protein [Bacillus wiedmannii]PRT42858.1 DUF5065 domain-containing protein [Bacillus wiedmannii]
MKLGKLALIGVLTFGGFTAVEMIKPTTQAAAAYQEPYTDPFKDLWGFTNIGQLPYAGTQTLGVMKDSYESGDEFYYTQDTVKTDDKAILKIYKVHADGSMQRYKTLYPSFGEPGHVYPSWMTEFTDVYTSGKYVAVFRDGSEFKYSKQFQVN